MAFEQYYRELTLKGSPALPHADEARRDYLAALSRTVAGLIAGF
jgi:hypothetical protein